MPSECTHPLPWTGDEHTYTEALAEMADGSTWCQNGPGGTICYRLLEAALQWWRSYDGWVTYDFGLATPPESGWYRYLAGSYVGGP